MLGCIQPMSSPMMKMMLGFCPCWAEAGMLAIVVAVHSTARAPQIVLNMLMVAFPRCWLPKPGPQPSPNSTHQPALPLSTMQGHVSAIDRTPRGGEIGRSAWNALCASGRFQKVTGHVSRTALERDG